MRINKKGNFLGDNLQRIFYLALRPFSFLCISLLLFQSDFLEGKEKKHNKAKFLNEIEINHASTKRTWEKYLTNNEKSQLYWEPYTQNTEIELFNAKKYPEKNFQSIGILNRSIVFENELIGPDISWIVPPGLKWNRKYKFDLTTRGHNTQIPDPKVKRFFAWNEGDAVGLFSYQFLHKRKYSFGLNLGIRSLYQGDGASGGASAIGEGLSSGFRYDYELSDKSGFAFGGEQLLHFDSLTDTGRNLYLTFTKAWWSDEFNGVGIFPLNVATAGIGTGRMAVGNIKGFCSNLLGGSGTEIYFQRPLCWAPIFSIARVWNYKASTFFEYNSRFFLLGTSVAPSQKIPVRGTFALILSDHADNYKLHNGSEMNWVFNLSLGF